MRTKVVGCLELLVSWKPNNQKVRKPKFRKSGKSRNQETGNHDIRTSGNPKIRTSSKQEMKKSGFPEIITSIRRANGPRRVRSRKPPVFA